MTIEQVAHDNDALLGCVDALFDACRRGELQLALTLSEQLSTLANEVRQRLRSEAGLDSV